MSRSYKQILELVQTEYESAKFCLGYVSVHWQKHTISPDEKMVTPSALKRALYHLEVTYIIRLFATFEGLLKQYMKERRPTIALPSGEDKMRVGWFIDRVSQLEKPKISSQLRNRVYEVRACRNQLMHSGKTTSPAIEFQEALQYLATYLSFLPDPL